MPKGPLISQWIKLSFSCLLVDYKESGVGSSAFRHPEGADRFCRFEVK